MGHVIIQLGSQRRQRAAARPADQDLPQQVGGQLLRQHRASDPEQVQRGLPRPGHAGIIKDRELLRDARLQRLQHCRMPGERLTWYRLAEDLADHQQAALPAHGHPDPAPVRSGLRRPLRPAVVPAPDRYPGRTRLSSSGRHPRVPQLATPPGHQLRRPWQKCLSCEPI